MKTLNTKSVIRSASRLAIFATLATTALVSSQAFAGKPQSTATETIKVEVPVTYSDGSPKHIDPRTGDTCAYNVPNEFCLGYPISFSMNYTDQILVRPWIMDWSSSATISVLRGKAFDEVDEQLLDQVYAPDTKNYIIDVGFKDTLVLDVWGDGTERYKIGFVSCTLDHDSEACFYNSNQSIRMSVAPL